MARRFTELELCKLIGDSKDELEMEVVEEEEEEEIVAADGSVYLDVVEDENNEIDDDLLAGVLMAAAEEDDDSEIRGDQDDPAPSTSETTTKTRFNTPVDLPCSDAGDFSTKWCKNLRGFPLLPEFKGTPGLKCIDKLPQDLDRCMPVDVYKLFVTEELIKTFKKETNLYASQLKEKVKKSKIPISGRSYITTWKPVKMHELWNFLAIIIHMSILVKPKIQDYWSKCFFKQSTFASQVMKRDRFMSILAMFHVNNKKEAVPKGLPNYDPLHLVRPLVDHLNKAFQTAYVPEQHISIDEAMCPWRGRLAFRIYMPDKPTRWGIKLYKLCESTSGYVYRFEVFCGMPDLSNRPYDVVQRLMEPLKALGYYLYTDRYYTSLQLAQDLAATNTGFTGTVMTNRAGLPKEFMNMKMEKGQADFLRLGSTMVLRWTDTREVSVLTTTNKPQMITVKTRTSEKQKPTVIVDYNKYMGGVDHSDQMVAYNPFHRKTVKWWKKLAFHLLSLTMVQAHCLYLKIRKSIGKEGMSLDDFMVSVGKALVTLPANTQNRPTGAAVQQPVNPDLLRFQGQHFMVPVDKKKQCVVCYQRLIREGCTREEVKSKTPTTFFKCKTCDRAMHVHPCMEAYHTLQDFSTVVWVENRKRKMKKEDE